jgi:hypothetical protein
MAVAVSYGAQLDQDATASAHREGYLEGAIVEVQMVLRLIARFGHQPTLLRGILDEELDTLERLYTHALDT